MKRSLARYITAMAVVALIPVVCSCSLFKKKQVIEAATVFGDTVRTGDAADIIRKTDGLDKEFKKSFKELLNVDNYTDEEKLYAAHMMDTIVAEVDASSVKVKKDMATCDMSFTIADHEALQNGDYRDIQALADAVDRCETRTISVTAELSLIEKEWYVTNFSDEAFQDIFAFLPAMPDIGRSTLIETATHIAKSVTQDDAGVALLYAASVKTPDMVDMPAYLTSLFDLNGTPSDEDIIFRDAVKSTMTYEIDESTLNIDGQKGSVVIRITMADYSTLAGKVFKQAADITDEVKACAAKTYSYTCELARNGADWYVINLDSDEFAAFLAYKKFSVSLKSVDGTYTATVDVTDKFVSYVSREFGITMSSDLEGRITITSTLVLKNGTYEVTIDRDSFVSNIKTFVDTNIDKIIMNMLGTTSSLGLDTLARLAGYNGYADMRSQILAQVTGSIESINTSGLESSGKFTLNDDVITLTSATDTMQGKIDNFGVITVTSPVNDPDAKKLLDSDTITLPFKKV
ncbi:MAG: hypothetical protein IKG01_05465 [Lachnospiraceae bacterium]|nr:hypothetical protein [Lachnospiraceae bacterium]